MSRTYLPGTQIEIINEFERGRIKYGLFDFDGTISILREGWQDIMHPVCVEMICGATTPTPEIEHEVREMIDETTGIQTILQMERLVEMVREKGLVPESEIQDAQGYKKIYLDRLMVPVRERLARLANGELSRENAMVKGAEDFLKIISQHDGIELYVFSGTDRDDVRNEANKLGVDHYFLEIWGALRTFAEYSKEKIINDLVAKHNLHGPEVMAVGDGPVELRNVKAVGGIAVGVASDEKRGFGLDEEKRTRLIKAGADIIVPDFGEAQALANYLFP
ncbi:MAG: HAD family hydrolase [Candidatus Hydrogenedentes bacterium]|nr:HAD family hydrolase [Candidatus Hydrogenedentota bacterium]